MGVGTGHDADASIKLRFQLQGLLLGGLGRQALLEKFALRFFMAALGIMAAGSGDTASKYVARRETPLYIPENCTQCMECIAVCPDTALPSCSQDLETLQPRDFLQDVGP